MDVYWVRGPPLLQEKEALVQKVPNTPIVWEEKLGHNTVWSEEFLYKVALPELKISPIMYFVIHNSVVVSKILKIVVPLEQNFEKSIFDSIKLIILIIIDIDKQESKWHNDFQYFG